MPLLPLPPLLIFLLLLVWGILKQKESWPVILPVLILHVFLLPLGYFLGSTLIYNLSGLCFGMAGLLLILDRINHENPWTRLVLAFAILMVFGFLSVIILPTIDAGERFKPFSDYILVSLIMLFSTVLAMRFCRRRFTDQLYLVWLLLSCIIFSMVYLLGSFLIALFTTAFNPIMLFALPVTLFMSVFMGLGIFIFILPFILLCLKNRIYRLKFFGIFKS